MARSSPVILDNRTPTVPATTKVSAFSLLCGTTSENTCAVTSRPQRWPTLFRWLGAKESGRAKSRQCLQLLRRGRLVPETVEHVGQILGKFGNKLKPFVESHRMIKLKRR